MKKAILTILGIAVIVAPAAVGFAQGKKPTAAYYITKEEVDTVNKTPGVDRTIKVMDIGDQHFSVGIIHRGSTTAPAAAPAARPAGAAPAGPAPGTQPCGTPAGMMTMSPVLTRRFTTSLPPMRPLHDGPFSVVVTSAVGAEVRPLMM